MPEPRASTAPENFQRSYAELSEPNKALISAMLSMSFALLQSIQQVQNSQGNHNGS